MPFSKSHSNIISQTNNLFFWHPLRQCYIKVHRDIHSYFLNNRLKRDLNLGQSRIAVIEDCKAIALTTQPPRLDTEKFVCFIKHFNSNKKCDYFFLKKIDLYLFVLGQENNWRSNGASCTDKSSGWRFQLFARR